MIVLKKKIPSSRTFRQIKIGIPYLKVIQEKQEKMNRVTAHYSIQEYIYSFVHIIQIYLHIFYIHVYVHTDISIHIYIIYIEEKNVILSICKFFLFGTYSWHWDNFHTSAVNTFYYPPVTWNSAISQMIGNSSG